MLCPPKAALQACTASAGMGPSRVADEGTRSPLDRGAQVPILALLVGTLPQVAGSWAQVKLRFSCSAVRRTCR